MITVVGAGFAGVEAAWAIASRGHQVRLVEMRPTKMTPAHDTGYFAELVCSNSLKSKSPDSPAGQLKYEMGMLGSLVLAVARQHEVPGGQALAVDRDLFGATITQTLKEHPLVEFIAADWGPKEVETEIAAGGTVILATGPLTTQELAEWLASKAGRKHLYFYDAVSPTVEASSINLEVAFAQSRYDKGGDDYLNCPFNREEYEIFVTELVAADRAPIHAFEAGGKRDGDETGHEDALLEKIKYFASCTPIEAIAEKGARSLAFGNFKPVGLTDPRTGRRPHAALQLRPENKEKTLYSLVACQTRLKWGEQKRVFRMVPGLETAEFVRYGVIHRNTYLDAPQLLSPELEFLPCPGLIIAGQLTGVEGYVESAAIGILAGLIAQSRLQDRGVALPPRETAYGSLLAHLQDQTEREFAPMNINWGLLPDPPSSPAQRRDKGLIRAQKIDAARREFDHWYQTDFDCFEDNRL